MHTTATVSDKGQVTLPKPLRDQLGIQPGSRLEFRLSADGTLQLKVLANGSASLAGLLAKPAQTKRSLIDMDAAVTETVVRRAKGQR
jgi:antitoxin PrlF